MANAIPLLEGTDASGGYLVPDELRETLVNKVNQESAVGRLVPAQPAAGKRARYPVYAGRPTVAVTGEAARKPLTGAEYAQLTVDIKKFAATVIYTEELLEDAREDPQVLLQQDLEGAFAQAVDSNALGVAAGANIVGTFNHELTATTSTVEYVQANQDAFATAVSSAMSIIEGNGGTPNGVIAGTTMRGALRGARGTDGRVLYGNGFTDIPGEMWGLPISYSSNLGGPGAPAAGRVIGVVGDFTNAKLLVRKDLTVRTSNEATLFDGTTTHYLWQENKVAALWEMRVGFAVNDLNRMFVAIVDTA